METKFTAMKLIISPFFLSIPLQEANSVLAQTGVWGLNGHLWLDSQVNILPVRHPQNTSLRRYPREMPQNTSAGSFPHRGVTAPLWATSQIIEILTLSLSSLFLTTLVTSDTVMGESSLLFPNCAFTTESLSVALRSSNNSLLYPWMRSEAPHSHYRRCEQEGTGNIWKGTDFIYFQFVSHMFLCHNSPKFDQLSSHVKSIRQNVDLG